MSYHNKLVIAEQYKMDGGTYAVPASYWSLRTCMHIGMHKCMCTTQLLLNAYHAGLVWDYVWQ